MEKLGITIICIPGITRDALNAIKDHMRDKFKDFGVEAIFTDKQIEVMDRKDIAELARILQKALEL